jgi:two-component system, OmpR family, response regulator
MVATWLHSVEPRPCLVLAHSDAVYKAVADRYLRQHGWEVRLAESGAEARRLARRPGPTVVALEAGLPQESGWLTCKKLHAEQPDLKVLLVTSRATEKKHRFAAFVGASGLIERADGVAGLVDAVFGAALRAVG